MKKVVITNQKGGVGKTTIGIHLAYLFVEQEKRVLYIDIDPQANSTKTLSPFASSLTASQLFASTPLSLPARNGLTVICADDKMVDIERADANVVRHFAAQIASLNKEAYDICIIDTPPTMGLRMTAALVIADYVLAPIELEEYSIDGIEKLLKAVIGVKSRFNPKLDFLGMLPNKFNPHSARQKAAMEQLLKDFARFMIPAKIGIRAGIPEALALGIPVWRSKKSAAREAGKEFKAALAIICERMGEAA